MACFLRPLVLFSVLMTCVVGTAATDTLNILELKEPGKSFSERVIKLWENGTEHLISTKSKVEAQWAKQIQADLLGSERRLWQAFPTGLWKNIPLFYVWGNGAQSAKWLKIREFTNMVLLFWISMFLISVYLPFLPGFVSVYVPS